MITQFERAAAPLALVGLLGLMGCVTSPGSSVGPAQPAAAVQAKSARPETAEGKPAPVAVAPSPRAPATLPAASDPPPGPRIEVAEPAGVVTVQPVVEPRYAPPESLKLFRFAQKNQPGAVVAKPGRPARPAAAASVAPAAPATGEAPLAVSTVEVAERPVATVNAEPEAPRYKLPDSLKEWGSGRKVPLYADPEAAPWQASPTEPRLQNAAVSCNYKDEGGVRGRVTLLVDDYKLTRFAARIEMPNGGICAFDSKKMEQRPFEQGIALQAKGDECVVRMWEQKHRITIAAYSCHKQCSKGSFSYLWPILMDTRIGTCY